MPCQPRPWRPTTTAGRLRQHRIPDLVRPRLHRDAPGTKFVGDITYIPTWEGFLYLATVIDCYTKTVVGWAMADHYKTSLIEAAIDMAAAGTSTLHRGCDLPFRSRLELHLVRLRHET